MKQPNILIFMTDQQRGDSIYPYERAITPNITKFCEESVTFTNAHTIAPHCCPSRATFFSGLYPSQHGVWNNVNVGNTLSRGLYDGVRLFSEDLKDNGYRMYFSGKWHVSDVEGPLDRGFDVLRISNQKYTGELKHEKPDTYEWGQYKDYRSVEHRKEGQIIRRGYKTYTHYGNKDNPFGDEDVIKDAIDIIKNRSKIDKEYGVTCYADGKKIDNIEDTPWCQYIGPLGPHDPYFVPKEFLDKYSLEDIKLPSSFYDNMEDKPRLYKKTKDIFNQLSEKEHKEAIRHYLAFCSYEDYLFGKVLEALEESGEAENTIVIYLSDHGDYMGEHGLWCKGLPCFEGAYHIPAVIRWPKGIKNPGRKVEDFITLADFAPTLLDATGINVDRKFLGYSLMPYLKDEKPEFIQEEIYTQSNGNELYGIQRSVKTKDWKFVYNGFDYDELYDLKNDPQETHNVYEKYKDDKVVKELSKKLWDFAYKADDVCINPYIMVGLASYGPGIIFEE